MVRQFLEQRNNHLLHDLDDLTRLLVQAQIPHELLPYRIRIVQRCQELRETIKLNLKYLALGQTSIINDVLSWTQQATQGVRLISYIWAIPILRAKPEDRLCLHIINWLHQSHSETVDYPPAFISSNCAIRPSQDITPLYLFPSLEQHHLLYQPLLFHEFGHFGSPDFDGVSRFGKI